ncbi:polyketide cyclase / dehydrase and lipid transport [mine drainage metagenome]|uniref:Polyketide cyclase / dehydrase and lipid transport n=1 Tax=mine drainage metagenome TaxID=410659 RepID=A0A1J5Q271_9ZZZZ
MKKIYLAMLASTLLLSLSAHAAGAKTLKVVETVEINAPADQVWEKVSNFGDLGAWHPAVKSTQITAGTNNKKGAVRLLTLQDGGTISEKLLGYNAHQMNYKYAIVEGVLPVSSYVSTITVKAGKNNTSTVTWKGSFKRKATSSSPAAGQDDETAVKTITGVYRGGLDNLKKLEDKQ